MTDQPENPPAFPVSTIDGFTNSGMALRDYFAAHALAGMLATGSCPDDDALVARDAFSLADAMLAERLRHD